MPHKRNPINTERICGLARAMRGNAQVGIDPSPGHERDISHSSAERVVLPDSTILIDYVQHVALRVIEGMTVHADRMQSQPGADGGALFSQRALLALVDTGLSRDDAYRVIEAPGQRAWDEQIPLRDLLAAEPAAAGLDLDAIFDSGHYTRHVGEIMARLDAIA